MDRYEVIESKVWRRDDGRTASIYGALPWFGDSEKSRWAIAVRGWTIRDNRENTVGCGRVPWKTKAEAETVCNEWNLRHQNQLREYERLRNLETKYGKDGAARVEARRG